LLVREFETISQHGSAYANNFSAEQNTQFTQQFAALTQKFKLAQLDALATDSDVVQALAKEHYEFCSKFWTPTRAAYKALAQSYLLPSPYRDAYEQVNAGLAKYHHDALVIWADANLD
jgi:hypothetical protein